MKINISQIIVFFSIIIISQKINAQSISAISIISTDVFFLRTEVTKSNTGPTRNGIAAQVITYYQKDYYLLKFSVKVNNNIESPLDLKLVSPTEKEKTYQLEKNIKLLNKDEIYDYNFEIVLRETGWYRFEIGDFTKSIDREHQNIVFDKSSIFVKK